MKVFILFLSCSLSFAQTTAVKAAPAKTGVTHTPTAAGALTNPAAWTAQAPEVFRVKFVTTKGDFVIEVDRSFAPQGADRFYNLIRSGFYNNVKFYRVVSGFMAQFGIPANPAVAKAWKTATIHDDPVIQSNRTGMVTFAKSGMPNSRTTEVYINLVDNSGKLDSQGFAPFGMVLEGMDVVQKLYSGYGDSPSMGGRGPDPTLIQAQGNSYLDKSFPSLDSIKSATIIFPEPAKGPVKK